LELGAIRDLRRRKMVGYGFASDPPYELICSAYQISSFHRDDRSRRTKKPRARRARFGVIWAVQSRGKKYLFSANQITGISAARSAKISGSPERAQPFTADDVSHRIRWASS